MTGEIANYLWNHYSGRTLGLGAGISAMPSLHIATAVWMVVSLKAIGSRLTVPVAILGVYLYVGSVALGWHYVLDGFVGGIGAIFAQWAALAYLNRPTPKIAATPTLVTG
jgi:hypothetical protein